VIVKFLLVPKSQSIIGAAKSSGGALSCDKFLTWRPIIGQLVEWQIPVTATVDYLQGLNRLCADQATCQILTAMRQMETMDEYFSNNYSTAREKFLAATRKLGWTLARYVCDQLPDVADGLLSCDVAISSHQGPAEFALIVSSGLHGVEGFFGSAVQHAWLQQHAEAAEKKSVRMIFIHALNPYGFAQLRRCDAENVDANRNFVLDPTGYHGHHALYEQLDSFLNPARPPSRIEPFLLKALFLIRRFGRHNLQQAVAEGQYDFPKGLFYGGQHPCWTRRMLEEHLAEWIGESSTVVHIDYHTGLGNWGSHQLLVDYTPAANQRKWINDHLGRHELKELSDPKAAYSSQGGLGAWCQHRYPSRQYIYLCAEFGTYSATSVLQALRQENQAHHWAQPDDPRTRHAKQQLLNAFCPTSEKWRRHVLDEGMGIINDAWKAF